MGSLQSSTVASPCGERCAFGPPRRLRSCKSRQFWNQIEHLRDNRRNPWSRTRRCCVLVEAKGSYTFGAHSLHLTRKMQRSRYLTRCLGSSTVMNAPTGGKDFFAWLIDLPWKRFGIWAFVTFVAYQLKDFFGVFMGTFLLAFIGNGFVESAQDTIFLRPLSERWRRRLLVSTFFLLIVSMLILLGVLTIPNIVREGADFVQRLKSDNIWVVVLEKMRHGLGDSVMDQVERILLLASGDDLAAKFSKLEHQTWTADRTSHLAQALAKMLRTYTDTAIILTTNLITLVSRFAVQVAVSLVLSFMVVWDLPTISAGIRSLSTSRLAPVYNEIAPSFLVFGQLFGKALQAQARIACVNTLLTAIGVWALAIPGLGLLSLIVFICSFIPIAGCFISTVPIGFVALTEYGFVKLALVVALVAGIHFIEAYGLNPVIYSSHLNLHPLLVLTVLVFAEHSVGIWGLLLAVPLTVFTLDYCIRYPNSTVKDVAVKELENVSSEYNTGRTEPSEKRYIPPSLAIRGPGKVPQLE